MTAGDQSKAGSYGYHPLDPLPVKIESRNDQIMTNTRLLKALPDETMRLAIGQVSGSVGITYGPATVGYEGNSYVVILDYVKFNTESFAVKLSEPDSKNERKATLVEPGVAGDNIVIVPVYVGVGLRLTANITVIKGKVNLGNLFAIGAEATAQKISGTLVVQTLGVSGENISSLIPMPSELNATTIQNAIMALGSIKAKLYDDKTTISPRVVGVYNNLGGGAETINGFISSILERPKVLNVP